MNEEISKEDALKVFFDKGIDQSASILSEIINKKISLSVSDVRVLDFKYSKYELKSYMNNVINGTIMGSSISFNENSQGKANLVFPAGKMREFINLCLQEEDEDYYQDLKFTDIDFDVIKEVGNIVLNSIIGEIGRCTAIKFEYTLPEMRIFNEIDIENIIGNKEYTHILMLYITFSIEDFEIEGAIIINLTLKTLDEILEKIYVKEDGLNGQDIASFIRLY
ncbi:MAG: chemotaxis protein CheC, inhibitor of methylation [Clostridia bacterium]|jgi:chemotaxis protein CheC|nr:chemotaxis protein CheC, inhibitor of methylation [Clostridia bacterium]